MTVRVVGRLSPAQRRELTHDLVALLYNDRRRRAADLAIKEAGNPSDDGPGPRQGS